MPHPQLDYVVVENPKNNDVVENQENNDDAPKRSQRAIRFGFIGAVLAVVTFLSTVLPLVFVANAIPTMLAALPFLGFVAATGPLAPVVIGALMVAAVLAVYLSGIGAAILGSHIRSKVAAESDSDEVIADATAKEAPVPPAPVPPEKVAHYGQPIDTDAARADEAREREQQAQHSATIPV